MKKIIVILVMLSVVAFANRDGGPYIGVGYGNSSISDDDNYFHIKDDSDTGYKIYAGAYMNKYFSVELSYLSDMTYTDINGTALEFGFIDVNVQAHYPFYYDKFDLYGKFGVGKVRHDGEGFGYIFGAGISLRFDEVFSGKIGYDYMNFGVDTIEDKYDTADKHLGIHYLFIAVEVQF